MTSLSFHPLSDPQPEPLGPCVQPPLPLRGSLLPGTDSNHQLWPGLCRHHLVLVKVALKEAGVRVIGPLGA